MDDFYQLASRIIRIMRGVRTERTYHARASARPAIPPAIRCVLSGIFSFGAGAVGDGLAGLPSKADLMDMMMVF